MGSTQEIVHKLHPFDHSMTDDMSMYDHFTYVRDIDICNERMITLVTGNVLKYFNFTIGEPYKLKGMDDLAQIKIKEYTIREQIRRGEVDPDLKEYHQDSELLESDEFSDLSANALEMEKNGGNKGNSNLSLSWAEEDGAF